MCANYLAVITITKGDSHGFLCTLESAAMLRSVGACVQIVVDGDGSAARTATAAGCQYLRQSGTGIAGAFNEGLVAVQSEWVWFLNGGDRVHEALDLAWLLALLRQTKADVVSGAIQYDGDEHPRPAPPLSRQWPMRVCWLQQPATIVRRAALQRMGGFDPRFRICMDYDFWQRLLATDPVVDVVAVPFARFAGGGLSQRPDTRPLLQRENALVLWRHKRVLLGSLLRSGLSVAKSLLLALWQRVF